MVYQDLAALKASISDFKPEITSFESSCFDGEYITGDVTPEYLDAIEQARDKNTKTQDSQAISNENQHSRQLDFNL